MGIFSISTTSSRNVGMEDASSWRVCAVQVQE